MSEWKEYKLGEIITLNYGKALKEQDRKHGEIPVYSSAGITGYHNEAIINSKGIIVGRKGTIGKVYLSEIPFSCIDTAYYILPNDEKYNFKFLYYLLQTIGLEELNSDSAVPGLNRDAAYSQEIIFPTVIEQVSIAQVLSSLDNKIDLLQRQNKTLEQLAETLFRQWFVEEVGENWELSSLDDIAMFYNGKSRPQEVIGGKIPIYGGNGILGFTDKSNYDGRSIIIGRVGAYCGSLYNVRGPVWITDNALLAKPKEDYYSNYLSLLLKSLELNSMAEGSSHPLLTQTLLKSIELQKPSEQKIKLFQEHTNDLYDKVEINNNQIRILTQLRDTLLPKLMSGEVRVEM